MALCGRAMGELIADDKGSILDAGLGIRFLDGGCIVADALVIATDDPSPEESVCATRTHRRAWSL